MKLEQGWEIRQIPSRPLELEIKEPIREQPEEELSGNEPEEQVRNRVRRLVREKELEL